MRTPDFSIYAKTKAQISCAVTAQLISAFLRYIDSTIPLFPKSDLSLLAIFCGCTSRFVSELFGNPEDRLCRDESYMSLVVRKPVFGDSDQVGHKPGCAVIEDG